MPLSSTTLPKTASVIDHGLTHGLHLGAQIYVSLAGNNVVDTAFGQSNRGLPMEPGTLMHWLSSGKPLTALAIAQLLDHSKLALDDFVARFIPEFANRGKEAITIRHLLTHTGGFRSADKLPETLPWEETIRRICQAPLEPDWPPGRKAGYHISSGWFVLGEIIRRVDGRFCQDYIHDEIFVPLEMRDSWLALPPSEYERLRDRLATIFLSDKGNLHPHPSWNTPALAAQCRPGSSARGPIHDLGRLYEHLLHIYQRQLPSGPPKIILKTETLRLFTSRQRIGLLDHTFMHKLDWGLGFMANSNRYGPETVPYGFGKLASEEAFGHSGAQSSSAFADPVHDLVVAWACNGLPGERLHQQRARAINTAIYEDLGLTSL